MIDDPVTYNRIFKPKRAIARSPTRGGSTTNAASTSSTSTSGGIPRTGSQKQIQQAKAQPPQKLFAAIGGNGVDEDGEGVDCPFQPPPSTNGELMSS